MVADPRLLQLLQDELVALKQEYGKDLTLKKAPAGSSPQAPFPITLVFTAHAPTTAWMYDVDKFQVQVCLVSPSLLDGSLLWAERAAALRVAVLPGPQLPRRLRQHIAEQLLHRWQQAHNHHHSQHDHTHHSQHDHTRHSQQQQQGVGLGAIFGAAAAQYVALLTGLPELLEQYESVDQNGATMRRVAVINEDARTVVDAHVGAPPPQPTPPPMPAAAGGGSAGAGAASAATAAAAQEGGGKGAGPAAPDETTPAPAPDGASDAAAVPATAQADHRPAPWWEGLPGTLASELQLMSRRYGPEALQPVVVPHSAEAEPSTAGGGGGGGGGGGDGDGQPLLQMRLLLSPTDPAWPRGQALPLLVTVPRGYCPTSDGGSGGSGSGGVAATTPAAAAVMPRVEAAPSSAEDMDPLVRGVLNRLIAAEAQQQQQQQQQQQVIRCPPSPPPTAAAAAGRSGGQARRAVVRPAGLAASQGMLCQLVRFVEGHAGRLLDDAHDLALGVMLDRQDGWQGSQQQRQWQQRGRGRQQGGQQAPLEQEARQQERQEARQQGGMQQQQHEQHKARQQDAQQQRGGRQQHEPEPRQLQTVGPSSPLLPFHPGPQPSPAQGLSRPSSGSSSSSSHADGVGGPSEAHGWRPEGGQPLPGDAAGGGSSGSSSARGGEGGGSGNGEGWDAQRGLEEEQEGEGGGGALGRAMAAAGAASGAGGSAGGGWLALLLEGLALDNIDALQPLSVCLQVACSRCSTLATLPPLRADETAAAAPAQGRPAGGGGCPPPLCAAAECACCHCHMSLGFRPGLLHASSNSLGSVQAEGCRLADLHPTLMAAQCGGCGNLAALRDVKVGQPAQRQCSRCHAAMGVQFGGVQFEEPGSGQGWHQRGRAGSRGGRRAGGGRGGGGRAGGGGGGGVHLHAAGALLHVGYPLPELGTCRHYHHSHRWLRFPCCGMRFACDLCHEEGTDGHEMRWANRMVCGYCSTEQALGEQCARCGKKLATSAAAPSGRNTRFWEGGQGCRDAARLDRRDRHKHTGSKHKTSSAKHKRVGQQAAEQRDRKQQAARQRDG